MFVHLEFYCGQPHEQFLINVLHKILCLKKNSFINVDFFFFLKFRAFEPPLSTVLLQCKDNCYEAVVLILWVRVYLREKKYGQASSEAFST